tara:strand:- start:1261 stop:3273 length:2013 start_codon:yes stop_codon:yes gene_type:complete
MKISFNKVMVTCLLLIFASGQLLAQSQNRKIRKADQAFELEEYYKAAELYKKAYKKVKNKALKSEIIFKQAECYRLSGNINRAESYYKRAIKARYPNVIVYLRYADMLRMNSEYEEALVQYQKYIQLNPSDVNGEKGRKSCELAVEWINNPTRYKVFLLPLVNSRFSDFSPAFGNEDYNEIYFTSSRTGGLSSKTDERTGEAFTDIYKTTINKKGKWSIPVLEQKINTEGNEGSVVVNRRGQTMYLTQCKVEKKKSLGCGIFVTKRKGKEWGDLTQVQIKVDSGASIGHPAISEDESVMIFSSDMSGGYGGKDLWIVKKEKRNNWSKPMNLGPAVNTNGDEMFPFLHPDGTLYFSSDGHIGMGGMDIYKSSQDDNGAYSSVVNLKSPVNSAGDDFGIIIEKGGERGYLTSNRSGGKGGDDIYQFELPPLKLFAKGVITDMKTGAIVTGAQVKLIGSDGSTDELKTDNTGSYNFSLKPLTSYEIIVTNEGYLKNSINETTVGLDNHKTFILDLSLTPVKKEIILPRIEYDFAKWDLRPKSIQDLDILVLTLKDNPGVVIELTSHTDYIGSSSQNMRLSQKRADACIEYLISQGIDKERLIGLGKGEAEPFVIEEKEGRFKEGDVLTESYISKIKFKKNREKANQFNRRTSFKVLNEDYVSDKDVNDKEEDK